MDLGEKRHIWGLIYEWLQFDPDPNYKSIVLQQNNGDYDAI